MRADSGVADNISTCIVPNSGDEDIEKPKKKDVSKNKKLCIKRT